MNEMHFVSIGRYKGELYKIRPDLFNPFAIYFIVLCIWYRGKIFSLFFSNSKTDVLELLENSENNISSLLVIVSIKLRTAHSIYVFVKYIFTDLN